LTMRKNLSSITQEPAVTRNSSAFRSEGID
jgi:hypothetical protein